MKKYLNIIGILLVCFFLIGIKAGYANGCIQKSVVIEFKSFNQNEHITTLRGITCLQIAMAQISVWTDYCYAELIACNQVPGPTVGCSENYNNMISTGYAIIESNMQACEGIGLVDTP